MGPFRKKKTEAVELGASLALLLFTWWKDEGRAVFDSALEKTSARATKKKAAEEALVLGMFAFTSACENQITEAAQARTILDSFHRNLYAYLLKDGTFRPKRVEPNLKLDATVVAAEFESQLVRPRYEKYREALYGHGPVVNMANLGGVAAKALGASQDDGIEILRFANIVSAVLVVAKDVVANSLSEYKIVT
jgi:hypothetical protein